MLNHALQQPVRKVYNEEKWAIKVIKLKMYFGLVSDECQNAIIFDVDYTPECSEWAGLLWDSGSSSER